MKSITILIIAAFVIFVIIGLAIYQPKIPESEKAEIKKFSSYSELENFIKTNVEAYPRPFLEPMRLERFMAVTEAKAPTPEPASEDYSTTNIQVAGVDEADIVKNDGKYIYVVSSNKIFIVDAYPAENAKILSTINYSNALLNEIFINNDRLIVFGYEYQKRVMNIKIATPPSLPSTFIKIYDISNRESPILKRNISVNGNYYDSRMIGDYVYVVVNQPLYYTENISLPRIMDNGVTTEIKASGISYFDYPDSSYIFTNILSINTQNDEKEISTETFLMGYTQNLFVSINNIYITHEKRLKANYFYEKLIEIYLEVFPDIQTKIKKIWNSDNPTYRKIEEIMLLTKNYIDELSESNSTEAAMLMKKVEEKTSDLVEEMLKKQQKTVVHRISLNKDKVKYETSGVVPGQVLNQFSMDEYKEHFRIATTTEGSLAGGPPAEVETTSVNNVYVLNMDMKIIGKLENLAPGERIFSARFLQDRVYLVTFRQVDPLFVIDLSNPAKPEVLGYLKVTGFSDYLHPYDSEHIIGIGQDVDPRTGRILGMKIALFDVSDVVNPKEISKYTIETEGRAYSTSEALRDHKAFLFSKQKNLLVLPIQISGWFLTEEGSEEGYKIRNFYGAYVFDISLDGIKLKGKISHDDTYKWQSIVRRSLYIDNVLYTISQKMIKANSLEDMGEITKIELPYERENNLEKPIEIIARTF